MIKIPTLRQHRLEHCSVCAQLPKNGQAEVTLALRQSTTEGTEYCLVYDHVGEDDETWYLHVELAVPKHLGEDTPKRKGSKRKFDQIVAQHSGVEVMANVVGAFRLNASLISPAGFVQLEPRLVDIPGVQSRFRGASIELKGLPVNRVDWRICPDLVDGGPDVQITIFGRCFLVLSENYLVEAIDFLKSGLSIVVTGEIDDIEN